MAEIMLYLRTFNRKTHATHKAGMGPMHDLSNHTGDIVLCRVKGEHAQWRSKDFPKERRAFFLLHVTAVPAAKVQMIQDYLTAPDADFEDEPDPEHPEVVTRVCKAMRRPRKRTLFKELSNRDAVLRIKTRWPALWPFFRDYFNNNTVQPLGQIPSVPWAWLKTRMFNKVTDAPTVAEGL